jgi:adenylate cyclase
MNERNFFSELKRRNVYKGAVAAAVVGWLLVQIAKKVFPFFEIPNWQGTTQSGCDRSSKTERA